MNPTDSQEQINVGRDTCCDRCASRPCRDLKQSAANFIVGIYVVPIIIFAVIVSALMIYFAGVRLFSDESSTSNNGGNSRTSRLVNSNASSAARPPQNEPKR